MNAANLKSLYNRFDSGAFDVTPSLPAKTSQISPLQDVKHFMTGAISSIIAWPLAQITTFVASKTGLIAQGGLIPSLNLFQSGTCPFDMKTTYNQTLKNILTNQNVDFIHTNGLGYTYRTPAPLTATPFYKTLAKIASWGAISWQTMLSPIFFEEILFRQGIQEIALKELPKSILKKVAPGKESLLDSRVAKVARIALASTLFSLYHLINAHTVPKPMLQAQLASTFMLGIGAGILKESELGLAGAIGLHLGYNIIAISPILWNCRI